jgi:hypothetical protein
MCQKAETGRDASVHGSGSAVSNAILEKSVMIDLCDHSTSIVAGLSSASSSGHYPNAIYSSTEDPSPNVLFVFAVSSVISLHTVI